MSASENPTVAVTSITKADVDEELSHYIVARVARSNAIIKSQQRGEPDITFEEKCTILEELLLKRPGTFLCRFHQNLQLEDLAYFETYRDDFEVDFYLKEARKLLDKQGNRKAITNRRYEYLRQMKASESDYFSNKEMRRRCPLLFEEFVGQYMTHDEREAMVCDSGNSVTLSQFLFNRIDETETQIKQAYEQYLEQNIEEEEEEDSDEEEHYYGTDENAKKITPQEKERLRTEFMSMMEDRFMEGKDEEFDYSKVDQNQEYDPIDDLQVDAEEAYFDSEEPYNLNGDKEDSEMEVVEDKTVGI